METEEEKFKRMKAYLDAEHAEKNPKKEKEEPETAGLLDGLFDRREDKYDIGKLPMKKLEDGGIVEKKEDPKEFRKLMKFLERSKK